MNFSSYHVTKRNINPILPGLFFVREPVGSERGTESVPYAYVSREVSRLWKWNLYGV